MFMKFFAIPIIAGMSFFVGLNMGDLHKQEPWMACFVNDPEVEGYFSFESEIKSDSELVKVWGKEAGYERFIRKDTITACYESGGPEWKNGTQ